MLIYLYLPAILFSSMALAKTDAEYRFCMKNVLDGKYLEQMQAEVVCTMASNVYVGCGMDLVDQGRFPNLIEAVEYCSSPTIQP